MIFSTITGAPRSIRGQREVCLEGENGFFSLKKTLWCSRWVFLNMVRSALIVRRLIAEQQIDCVVCDTMYGGVLAARFQKVPVVFITNQNRFSGPGAGKTLSGKSSTSSYSVTCGWQIRSSSPITRPRIP